AGKGKPVILSTAMATLDEIEEAIEAIRDEDNEQIILLHCGIGYPLKLEDVNLAAMKTLKQAFTCPVGYSDHTLGITVPIAAVARGARVIEKHFTINRRLPGPDHLFALEPPELKAMIAGIRDIEIAIGSPQKRVLESELIYYQRGRRSLFAKVDIPEGTTITEDMLAVLRPGIGLKPKYLDSVVGRKARLSIKAHEPITWDRV
ncbi:N-acetylneuraminate synthase family protein, partial [Chloroflexota bacterium]